MQKYDGDANVKKILLINPKKDFYKKKVDQALNARQLNFGILAIASTFPEHILIYDCQGKEHSTSIEEIINIIKTNNVDIVGISLISAYSEKSAFSIADAIHKSFKNIPIVYGGKDHAPYIAEKLIYHHHGKVIVKYDGESFFKRIILDKAELSSCPSVIYKNKLGQLVETEPKPFNPSLVRYDHRLYPDFLEFIPSIEVSRGCNRRCIFCSNNKMRQIRKNVNDIIAEINDIKSAYGERICAYFQTPHFLLSRSDLKALAKARLQDDPFIWRTQTSVRYLTTDNIILLHAAGARAIDVGFESASSKTLLNMGKDRKPDNYIAIMKKALKTAANVGLRLKLNILLFAGETAESLTQTMLFLKENLHHYHSFSAYPAMLFPTPNSSVFLEKIKELQACTTATSISDSLSYVNLSPQINYKKASKIALLLGKALQSHDMYCAELVIT